MAKTTFTGPIVAGSNGTTGEIRLTDGKNVNEQKYLALAAPATITADTTLTFPNGAGSAGQILSTDGNGTLSWVNDSAGNPAGTNGQVQVNSSGVFGAISEGTSGQVLTSNGAGAAPTFQAAAAGGIAAVVDDTTPQLGGNLDLNGNDITGTGNLDISNGTIKLDGDYPDGTMQVALGNAALDSNSGGSYNTAIGSNALTGSTTSSFNVAVGMNCMQQGNGNNNVAMGANAFAATNGSGAENVAIGVRALYSAGNGGQNVAVGARAMDLGAGGYDNVCVGWYAGENGGNSNGLVAIGSRAAQEQSNAAIAANVAIGRDSLRLNVTGTNNTAVGHETLRAVTTSTNTALGAFAGYNANTGDENTFIGNEAGFNISTGSQNTFLGQNAGSNMSIGSNNVVIGRAAQAATGSSSNSITLGNSTITVLRCQQTSITALSDARDKKDIEDANLGLDFINDLRPVKFVWNERNGKRVGDKEVGFIAQELDEVQQKHGVEDYLQLVLKENPDKLEAAPGKLIPILVQAIKDLKKEIDELKKA